jgi:transcriptional regulator with PAS, ATPase and Fis domain
MSLQGIKQRFGIIGRSEKLDLALGTAERVAGTDLSVLINGESGVGKEVFSKIIHALSPRKHNKFIAVNCGAIPEGTINSELFGHEKGSFTGAASDRKGYFETVNTGTIFLDEIGELPLDTQAYLLRILESGEFLKVGSSKMQTSDVRIIAATNVDLRDRIKQGRFREDLFYRLNTVPITVPSLKERPEDIFMLFRKFAVDFAEKYKTSPIQLEERSRLILENYSWPGNIRELKNVAEQLSVLSEDKIITADALVTTMPHLLKRNLPAIQNDFPNTNGSGSFQEREILFKFLFEMKSDLTDLKKLVFELIRSNDLNMPDSASLSSSKFNPSSEMAKWENDQNQAPITYSPDISPVNTSNKAPIILDSDNDYESMEIVEESLSLEDMEKDMIQKALSKYKGKRKEAATELGISERTLYRKIKQYEL